MSVSASRPALQTETVCAICGPHEYEVVGTRDRNGRPLRTVLCTSCGLVWTNPRPSDADVDRYYASSYRVDYARQHVPSRRKILRGLTGAEERRKLFAAELRAGERVLDIGCGAGEFVFLLRARGVDATGIEPGEEFSDFSRRVMQVPIQTATVESATVAPGSQRLITMFHMLEHAADPRRTLSTIRGWLAHQGRLVVEVPSVDATVQAPAHRFHYAHLYNFTAATLGALGEAVGLSVVKTMHSDDGGNVMCVFEANASGPRAVAPVSLPDNVARLRQVFGTHRALGHYAGLTPYRRALQRLARRRRENRQLKLLPTMEAVLEWGRTLSTFDVGSAGTKVPQR
jgi:2-polyprenyl-3-methyl-5-hydroxy-6-metoxy-1,4-benzoquinol methylase